MQVVIYDQLVTDNVILNDGDESKGGVLCDEAELSEENQEELMSQATSSSANKQLSFK